MRYINEVGRMVIGDSNQEADEIKEGDKLSSHPEAHTDTESTQVHIYVHCDTYHVLPTCIWHQTLILKHFAACSISDIQKV